MNVHINMDSATVRPVNDCQLRQTNAMQLHPMCFELLLGTFYGDNIYFIRSNTFPPNICHINNEYKKNVANISFFTAFRLCFYMFISVTNGMKDHILVY